MPVEYIAVVFLIFFLSDNRGRVRRRLYGSGGCDDAVCV
jgi:hypothetical protein